MSKELVVNFQAKLVRPGITYPAFNMGTRRYDQAVNGLLSSIITIATGAEQDISLATLTTPGLVCMLNLEATGYIKWGPKSAGVMVPVGHIIALDTAHFRHDGTAILRMQAYTNACKLLLWVAEA